MNDVSKGGGDFSGRDSGRPVSLGAELQAGDCKEYDSNTRTKKFSEQFVDSGLAVRRYSEAGTTSR
ncbi:MAG TPA: hypothetical protein VKW78_05245 [Terriglobales bacterium]|nr:hypothetical protein [Terriglobales bacterium]